MAVTNFLLMIVLQSVLAFTNTQACLSRGITGSGFHLKLVTNVSLPKHSSRCVLVIHESFPPNVFADPHQLKADELWGGPVVQFAQAKVDLEAPTSFADPLELWVRMPISFADETISVQLPIHVRYQDPTVAGQMIPFVIHAPKAVIQCEEDLIQVDSCKNEPADVFISVPTGHKDQAKLVTWTTLSVTIIGAIILIGSVGFYRSS